MENFKIQLDAKDYYKLYDDAKSYELTRDWWKKEEAERIRLQGAVKAIKQALFDATKDENGLSEHSKYKELGYVFNLINEALEPENEKGR